MLWEANVGCPLGTTCFLLCSNPPMKQETTGQEKESRKFRRKKTPRVGIVNSVQAYYLEATFVNERACEWAHD